MTTRGSDSRDAKRQRREAALESRRQEQRRRQGQRRRRPLAIYGGVAVAVAAAAALIAWAAIRPTPPALGEQIPGQGQAHVQLGQAHPPYNSNPPTSGWHTPQEARWGAHRTEIPDEVVLHNLEHGGIWISYKDSGDDALVEKLETLASRYRSKVILTPRPRNDSPIAVAAWERLLKLDTYDEGRIVAFINAYRNKGPERVPD